MVRKTNKLSEYVHLGDESEPLRDLHVMGELQILSERDGVDGGHYSI